jgi:hypothetical protein
MFTRSGLDLSAVWDKYSHLCEMDDGLRDLERASRQGDPDARHRYIAHLNRAGNHGAALRHVIEQHRDHMLAWRAAIRKGDDDAAKHHGSEMWSARRQANEHAERYGLHLGDHVSRHSDENSAQFLGRAVHLHEPHGTTFHPFSGGSSAVVKFDSEHGRTRDDVANRRRPKRRPHEATAAAFHGMWNRETGGQASMHTTEDGDHVTGTAVTVHEPEGSTTRP